MEGLGGGGGGDVYTSTGDSLRGINLPFLERGASPLRTPTYFPLSTVID